MQKEQKQPHCYLEQENKWVTLVVHVANRIRTHLFINYVCLSNLNAKDIHMNPDISCFCLNTESAPATITGSQASSMSSNRQINQVSFKELSLDRFFLFYLTWCSYHIKVLHVNSFSFSVDWPPNILCLSSTFIKNYELCDLSFKVRSFKSYITA